MFHDYAARAIRLYPTTYNPFLSVFDPHHFISGLVGRCHAHPSLLLVNTSMCWAYVGPDYSYLISHIRRTVLISMTER